MQKKDTTAKRTPGFRQKSAKPKEVAEFVTDQSNECGDNIYHSIPYLTEVLNSVGPEERMGAVLAAREAEEGGAQ